MLRVGVPAPLGSLAPDRPKEIFGVAVGLVYPGLFRLEPDGTPGLALAERYAWSDGGKKLQVRVRAATFHDGAPVTAADVARALRSMPAELSRSCGGALDDLTSIEVISDRELAIELARPRPDLLRALEYGVRSASGAGAGAYRVAAETPDRVTLDAVDGAAVGFPRIEVRGFRSTEELWRWLVAGELDLVPYLPDEARAALGRYPWIRRWSAPAPRLMVVRASPTLRRPALLAEAIGLAADRPRLVRLVQPGAAPLASRDRPGDAGRPDAGRARELLAGLGYRERPLVLGFPAGYSEAERLAAVLATDLDTAGVAVILRAIPPASAGVRFEGEDAHVTNAALDRAQPGAAEALLYRQALHSAAGPVVCEVPGGAYSPLPYLDRVRPCGSPAGARGGGG